MEKQKSIVILCAGGPAPGINTVVATVTKGFLTDGFRVLGLMRGYKTLFAEKTDYVELSYELVDRFYDKGGSYLKMSRYKPKKEEYNTRFFEEENVQLLVTIGGDDTATSANNISTYLAENSIKVQNIHVPKTIDNDLPLPDHIHTFGYQTAKSESVRIASTVFEDARTSDAWFVVSAMGREAGHLAYGIGDACHYPMIIIPEMFFGKVEITFDRIINMIVSAMVKRLTMGLEFGAVIISEGVFHFISDEEIKKSGIRFTYDEHGHPELGNVSKAHIFNILLQTELQKLNINLKSRPVEIGYEVRCCPPIAFDLRYCTRLGYGVKELFDRGESRCIALATPSGQVKALYLKDLTGDDGKITPRLVDTTSESYEITMKHMEYIKEGDYEAAKKYLKNPEDYDLKNILK